MNFSDAIKEMASVVEHLVRTHEFWNDILPKDQAIQKIQNVAKMVDDVVDPIADATLEKTGE